MASNNSSGPSNGVRTIVTLLLLVFALPLGVIIMWVWTRWSSLSKWILTILAIPGFFVWLAFMGIIITIFSQPSQ